MGKFRSPLPLMPPDPYLMGTGTITRETYQLPPPLPWVYRADPIILLFVILGVCGAAGAILRLLIG